MSKRVVPPTPLRLRPAAVAAARILGAAQEDAYDLDRGHVGRQRLLGVGVRDQAAAIVDDVDLEELAAGSGRDLPDVLQARDREHDAEDTTAREHRLAQHDDRLLQRLGDDGYRDHRVAVLAALEGLLQLLEQPRVLERQARLRADTRRVDDAHVDELGRGLQVALERLVRTDPRHPGREAARGWRPSRACARSRRPASAGSRRRSPPGSRSACALSSCHSCCVPSMLCRLRETRSQDV